MLTTFSKTAKHAEHEQINHNRPKIGRKQMGTIDTQIEHAQCAALHTENTNQNHHNSQTIRNKHMPNNKTNQTC